MNEIERLTTLEERYAHLQRHSVEQDKVMLELSEAVAQLRKEITGLRTQRADAPDPGSVPDERPPHY